MALAITISDVDAGGQNLCVFGTLTASDSYSTGGDTLDFTTVAGQLSASLAPLQVWIGGSKHVTPDNKYSVTGIG